MSGMNRARAARLQKWAAEQGRDGCLEFIASSKVELKARAMGRRRSSESASDLQARMSACRRLLRITKQQGEKPENKGVEMDRSPSTSIKPVKPSGILPPTGARAQVFKSVMEAGRKAHNGIQGLTCIDASRAFFQVIGDKTYYSIAITPEESKSLGYIGA